MSAREKYRISSLVEGDFYTEGPAIDTEGNIYYTTLTGGRIMKLDASGESTLWAETPRPNGQRILSNGDHLVCESKLGRVVRFDAAGRKAAGPSPADYRAELLTTPNDLAVDADEGFYVTDSVRHTGRVFFFDWKGNSRIVVSEMDYPNGVALSRDRSRLFVAESYRNRVVVIDLDAPGVPSSAAEVFCELPWNDRNRETGNLPDGILLDSKNRLWVAHYGMQAVHMVSADGTLSETFDSGLPLTSNIAFTKDETGLVITGGKGEPGPGGVNYLSLSGVNDLQQ